MWFSCPRNFSGEGREKESQYWSDKKWIECCGQTWIWRFRFCPAVLYTLLQTSPPGPGPGHAPAPARPPYLFLFFFFFRRVSSLSFSANWDLVCSPTLCALLLWDKTLPASILCTATHLLIPRTRNHSHLHFPFRSAPTKSF